MRCACAVVLLGVTACADEARPPEPEPWPAPMRPIPTADAIPPDIDARWTDLAVLRWPAAIADTSGIELQEPCFVEALTDGPRIRRVTAVCGAQTLYDSDRARYGGPVDGATLRERLLGDGFVHGLVADHTAGGVHLRVATREESATIEQNEWLGWSVQLRPVAWTELRSDPALLVPNTVESRAAVLHLPVGSEAGGLDPDAVCRVDVRVSEAFGTELSCAVGVDCDELEVIAPATEGPCRFEGGALASVEIEGEDGAPSFSWTAMDGKGSLVVDGRSAALVGNVGSIGIRECDAYLTKYRACLHRFPEASRSSIERALATTEHAWKEAADGPARAHLATACEAAHDAMRSAFASVGCTA